MLMMLMMLVLGKLGLGEDGRRDALEAEFSLS